MKVTNAFLGTMLLLINLPLTARPASNSEPTGTAIGTMSQTMQPTDEAAGLFTPASPGNAAAYKSQLNGGLRASPIVDGSGANLRVMVPIASPPATQSLNMNLSPVFTNVMAPYPVARQTTRIKQPASTVPTRTLPRQQVLAAPSLVSKSFVHRGRMPIVISSPANTLDSIGQLTGAITYADGQKVLIGTEGNARIDPNKGTVTLPNGARLSMKSAAKSVRQVALKNQVRL